MMKKQHQSTHAQFLAEIEAFLARTGMSATRFGEDSVNDRKLVANLRAGADVGTRRMDRVRLFMATFPERARLAG